MKEEAIEVIHRSQDLARITCGKVRVFSVTCAGRCHPHQQQMGAHTQSATAKEQSAQPTCARHRSTKCTIGPQ